MYPGFRYHGVFCQVYTCSLLLMASAPRLITEKVRILLMATPEGNEHQRRHGRHFLIPAGVLIGLGVGLITGYAGPGVLIGLGLGLLASVFIAPTGIIEDHHPGCCGGGSRWGPAIIGLFLILFGIGVIWAPANIWTYVWPYGIGIFLILIGLSFIAKMWQKSG
jgi:hypothetical protein